MSFPRKRIKHLRVDAKASLVGVGWIEIHPYNMGRPTALCCWKAIHVETTHFVTTDFNPLLVACEH